MPPQIHRIRHHRLKPTELIKGCASRGIPREAQPFIYLSYNSYLIYIIYISYNSYFSYLSYNSRLLRGHTLLEDSARGRVEHHIERSLAVGE